MSQPGYIAAIDQGTTGTRCMLFRRDGTLHAGAYEEHAQHYPQPGWVEHDPTEIWARTQSVVHRVLAQGGVGAGDVAAVGITNQRETTVVWERAVIAPGVELEDCIVASGVQVKDSARGRVLVA